MAVGLIGTYVARLSTRGICVNPSFMPVLSSPFLLGHEHPFSILLLHISQQLQRGGESSVQNAPVQFIVRKKVAAGENMAGEC